MTTSLFSRLRSFLDNFPRVALVEVAAARGSTPREKGAWMLVSPTAIFGTIGGGQLEYMAIDRARDMLAPFSPNEREMAPQVTERIGGSDVRDETRMAGATPPSKGKETRLDIPLGPEIGQCCGGRVEVLVRIVDDELRAELTEAAKAEDARRPHVYIFGGGHVGHALASAFALLPVYVAVVETRAEALEGMPDGVERQLTPVPEEMVRAAPVGSAFVVLTHDHALDFLIVGEALKRNDAAYVGMIGSKTKKATFRSWFLKTAGGSESVLARLVSPIGGEQVKDKRPAVIAALTAAEIMTALARHQVSTDMEAV
jgi:xanthine dehydrogenase accessory factor